MSWQLSIRNWSGSRFRFRSNWGGWTGTLSSFDGHYGIWPPHCHCDESSHSDCCCSLRDDWQSSVWLYKFWHWCLVNNTGTRWSAGWGAHCSFYKISTVAQLCCERLHACWRYNASSFIGNRWDCVDLRENIALKDYSKGLSGTDTRRYMVLTSCPRGFGEGVTQ